MIRRLVLSCGMAGAILAIPGHAQDRGAEARLDDFALPEAKPALGVEQLTAQDPSELPQQRVDRALAQPLQTDATGAMPAQISSEDTGGAVAQLPSARESRLSLGTAVSHTSDSAPRTAAPIGGQDRCDPQLTQKFYAECLRILELRSDEFTAPQPAALSAEQKLLVEQRQRDDGLADAATAVRLRYAAAPQPDADLKSNQELAAIYLGASAPTPTETPAESAEEPDLGEILQTLGVTTTPTPNGP